MSKQPAPFRRVIVLTPNVRGADGVSELSRQILAAFRPEWESGVRVELWSLTERPCATAGGSRPLYRFAAGSKLRFAGWGLRAALGGARDTLVVAVHLALAPVALPLVARGGRLAVILLGIEAWRPLGRLPTRALEKAWRILAISRHTVERFRAANPAHAARPVEVCHLGTSPLTSEGPPGAAREAFALIVGRMAAEERYKGHDLLLDVWPRVVREVPGARLVVAGDGNDRGRLERRAAEAGLVDHVRFLGRVPQEELNRLYRECAFFVMPSRNEGFGLVFLEAMRAGKACIGATGAAAEVIEDGVTGLVVDPGEPERVREAVVRLFRDADLRERMGAAGARRVAREFTAEHFARRFRRLLGLGTAEPAEVAGPGTG